MKNELLVRTLPVGILSLTILVSVLIFASSGIYVRNLGSQTKDGEIANSINVSGSGEVYAEPDVLNLSVSASEVAGTSSEALATVNQKINEVFGILITAGVEERDIQTSSLSIYPEYDYSLNGNPRLIGQRASISLSATVRSIDQNIDRASGIIDQVSGVANIQIGNISFGIGDDSEYVSKAREMAYKEAEQKGVELSSLAGVKLLKPLSITDSYVDMSPVYSESRAVSADLGGSPSTSINPGQLLISVSLNVVFGIQ